MKKLFLLLLMFLLLSVSFAEFKFRSMDISVTLNEDGSANVIEKINIMAIGQQSMLDYEAGFNKNTLSDWQQITNLSEIRNHISTKYCDIPPKSIVIMPQSTQKSKSGMEAWHAQIIISYTALPYYNNSTPINNTGIVTMNKYKPRTIRYTLNENAFDSLPHTQTGNIKLDETISLTIIPPKSAKIFQVNPLTEEMYNTTFPTSSKPLKWHDITLIQFFLVYEIEQTLDKEVVEFFSTFQQEIRLSMVSQEGMASLVIAGILIFSYFYLRTSKKSITNQ